jgi:murein DD-endopeptidase MepM/ murein hydrolase activator NlpD
MPASTCGSQLPFVMPAMASWLRGGRPLALSEHDVAWPSASSSTPIASPESIVGDRGPGGPDRPTRRPSRRARIGRRIALTLVAGGVLSIVASAPTSAGWPVATRSSYISQWAHRTHMAIDIAAPAGTRLVPIRSGRVVFAGWKSNCGGYQVWVSHGHGLYSAYYHMSRETSYRGEWVSQGTETIGYVGRTGCATGPHVHVEVWHGYPWRAGSYRVNPWRYLDAGYYLPYRYR